LVSEEKGYEYKRWQGKRRVTSEVKAGEAGEGTPKREAGKD
jgi:hypothetical protein